MTARSTERNAPPFATSYGLFWSDTAEHFRGVEIVRLKHPGDLIRFEMLQNEDGWRLVVKNISAGWARSIEVHYAPDETFNQGEWLQEDPATGEVTSTDVPYADTSEISFQRLRLDGRIPSLKFTDGHALSTVGGTYLVPTHVRHDAFSLVSATGAARQFLADAEKLDSALYAGAELFLPGSHPTIDSARSLTTQWAKFYGHFADQIRVQAWPSAAQPLIARTLSDEATLQTHMTRWVRSDGSMTDLAQIFRSSAVRRDDQQLRAVLGLPPV